MSMYICMPMCTYMCICMPMCIVCICVYAHIHRVTYRSQKIILGLWYYSYSHLLATHCECCEPNSSLARAANTLIHRPISPPRNTFLSVLFFCLEGFSPHYFLLYLLQSSNIIYLGAVNFCNWVSPGLTHFTEKNLEPSVAFKALQL